MTREEAIKILDEVIPPPEHHTVDLDHLRIAQAWLCIKETLTAEPFNCSLEEFGECSYRDTGCSDCKVKEKVRNAIDKAEPIKQGVWKVYDILDYAKRPTGRKIAQCSNCGKLTPEFRRPSEMPNWNFCPTCGYLMRKENEDISNSGVGQKGHWVFRAQGVSCSICGAKAPDVTGLPSTCQVCGAKMY